MFHFDLDSLKARQADINTMMEEQSFWENSEKSNQILQENKHISKMLEEFNSLVKSLEDIEVLIELSEDMTSEEEDMEIHDSMEEQIKQIKDKLEEMTLQMLFSGEYDANNAILSINSGTGGLDAQDWSQMLLRMYTRWMDDHGYSHEITDYNRDTEGGIKSVTLLVKGYNVYGYLKAEKGVHRLVRISPFDTNKKRHTSFASVDVYPVIEDHDNIELDTNDLRIDTYRASGAGGQHVNTTDSAVRITHIPTGVTVQCQSERSQISNRETAMGMMKAKLIAIKEEENREKIEDIQGKYNKIAWGSQIRSYVFHPYTLVKDHRTNYEVGNGQAVMDGDLDGFINEYLKMKTIEQKNN